MVLRILPYKAGLILDDEALSAEGYAIDTQWIRWVRGHAEAIGGWANAAYNTYADGYTGNVGALHGVFPFADNAGVRYCSFGVEKFAEGLKLFVFRNDATGINVGTGTAYIFEITPERANGTYANNPFATTNGSAVVTVTQAAHGATTGDMVIIANSATFNGITPGGTQGTYANNPITTTVDSALVQITQTAHGYYTGDEVTIAGAAAVGGITLSGTYVIARKDANTIAVVHSSAATSSATGGGAAVTYSYGRQYVLTVVNANSYTITHIAAATGTGSGGGAAATYRNMLASVAIPYPGLQPWALSQYGQTLIASPFQKGIYRWASLNTLTRPAAVANSPAQNNWSLVTAEGYLMALGCTSVGGTYTPMLIRWSDSTDITIWTPSATNNAGSLTLGVGSQIITARNTRGGILVWTDTALYFLRYTGTAESQYEAELLGTECGAYSPYSVIEHSGSAYWIGGDGQFYAYTGGAPRQLNCPIKTFMQTNLGTRNVMGHFDSKYQGAWWFLGASPYSIGYYVRLDLLEYVGDQNAGWSAGDVTLDLAGMADRGLFPTPIVFGSGPLSGGGAAGMVYYGESVPYGGQVLANVSRFVSWAPIDISSREDGDGNHVMNLRRFVLEFAEVLTGFSGNNFTVTFTGRRWPVASATTQTYSWVGATTEYKNVKMQARQVAIKIETTSWNDSWRLGNFRLDISMGPPR